MIEIVKSQLLKESNDKNNKLFKLEYVGRGISLNKIYAQGHWKIRHDAVNEYKEKFSHMIKNGDLEHMNKFSLYVFYNSRHDPDNVVGMVKVFLDTLKGSYIIDDNKKYFKGFSITPDSGLKNNTFQFYIVKHGN